MSTGAQRILEAQVHAPLIVEAEHLRASVMVGASVLVRRLFWAEGARDDE